jgi:DNA primase
MSRIPEETIQAIRDRVDVVDLIGRYVTLKKAGRSFKGLCPFHQEKTASFTVNPERGIFHCFGCGESGNAIAFLMRHENLTFPEAARALAAECGIEIPRTGGGGGEPGVTERVLSANGVAQELYRATLMAPEGEEARAYLDRRGLGQGLAEHFGIGFAPDRWDAVTSALARQRIPAAVGEQAGLLKERERGGHYDLLRGRITFPIQDVRGRVIGFGGRALRPEQEPKYLNTPESPVFRKREVFYGFPFALEPIRRNDRAVVVEGYFDLIALHRAGIEESVATCGTALTEGHARNLRRRTRTLVLLFDGDEAGQRAVLRALEVLLPEGFRVRVAVLPAGEDPDDFLAHSGVAALRDLVDSAPPALDLAIQLAVSGGCATPWEKADAVAAVAPLLAVIPDPVERGEYARRVAMMCGSEVRDVESVVRRLARGRSGADRGEEARAAVRSATPEDRRFADVVQILLEHPGHAGQVEEDRLLACAPDEVWNELTVAVLGECRGEGGVDVAVLADRLEGLARERLLRLGSSSEGLFDDAERALRALRDTVAWLERRRQRIEAKALTARLRIPSEDHEALLLEKDRQLERLRSPGGPQPH